MGLRGDDKLFGLTFHFKWLYSLEEDFVQKGIILQILLQIISGVLREHLIEACHGSDGDRHTGYMRSRELQRTVSFIHPGGSVSIFKP